jgi:hypothetical protein
MMRLGAKGPLGGSSMVDPPRDDVLAAPGVIEQATADRRRAGRGETVSPDLIPLLRNPASLEIPPDDPPAGDRIRDDGGPATGIAMGLLLAIPCWCVIALGVWWAVG